MNVYRLRATALCPAEPGGRDHYDVEVRSEQMIRVEELLQFFNARATRKIFHEDLAREAREHFAGAVVVIEGAHPTGVQVVAVADDAVDH